MALLALLSQSAAPTRAEMISFSFNGKETLTGANHPISGSITYDTNAKLLSSTSGTEAQRTFSTAGSIIIKGFYQTFSTQWFPVTPLLVTLSASSIAFHYQSPGPRNVIPASWLNIDLQVGDGRSALFADSSSLPTRLPQAPSTGSFHVLAQEVDPEVICQGVLSSCTPVAAAPEPSCLALAAAGCAGLALASRWRRHAPR
jgi:hypothetical protein